MRLNNHPSAKEPSLNISESEKLLKEVSQMIQIWDPFKDDFAIHDDIGRTAQIVFLYHLRMIFHKLYFVGNIQYLELLLQSGRCWHDLVAAIITSISYLQPAPQIYDLSCLYFFHITKTDTI